MPVLAPGTTPATDGIDCRSGWVCLYTVVNQAPFTPGAVHTDYYYYGYDNLSNVVGTHWIVNNQTGSAVVYLCYNYGGTNCSGKLFNLPGIGWVAYLPAGEMSYTNFTPINSIRLCASASCSH